MKKLAIAAILAGVFGSASALEVGLVGGRSYLGGATTDNYGVTVGQKVGAWGLTGEVDRLKGKDTDRWSVIGSYRLATLGPIGVDAKVGGSYLQVGGGTSGYAALAGLGAELDLTKSVAVTGDWRYQEGQERVKGLNGSQVMVGVKYRF